MSNKVKHWHQRKPKCKGGKRVIPLTVGDSRVVPLTVGNRRIVPLTVDDQDDWWDDEEQGSFKP